MSRTDQEHADRLWEAATAFEDAMAAAHADGLTVDLEMQGGLFGLTVSRVQKIVPSAVCNEEAEMAKEAVHADHD